MNAISKPKAPSITRPDLLSIFRKAANDYREMDEMFQLLGWSELPLSLKLVIEDDIRGYTDELKGRYSTNCPAVQRRRESIEFWVKSYLNELCSLETALHSLKVNRL